ncbi:hypothetical protein D3C78_886130 [compost metagenome]
MAGTHVQDDARHLGQFWTQAVNQLAGRNIAFVTVLERDPKTAIGDGLVAASDANCMGKRSHGWIGLDNFGQRLVFFDHVRIGNVSSTFRCAKDKSGVLQREEPLGNGDITGYSQGQGDAEDAHHQALMSQRLDQDALVPGQQTIAKGDLVLVMVVGTLHEQGAQGWRQGQRDHH